MRSTSRSLAVLTLIVWTAATAARGEPSRLRVLLLSGQNNHDWRTTTPALVKIYEQSRRFRVTVTDEPGKLTRDAFARCDVVVSNWTPWPNVKQRIWDRQTEGAFLDFVRGGRGLVVFHAACTACQSWPEFQQLIGGTWALGKTGHGRRHEFAVRIADRTHPVTAGMADFRIFDELWHRLGTHADAKVLCTAFSAKDTGGSGQAEPVALWTRLGKGRGFNLVLGHDVRAMSSPGWQTLMLRGTEWAATGKVTLPAAAAPPAVPIADFRAALKAAYGYEFGRSRKPLMAVGKLVQAASRDPKQRKAVAAALARSLGDKCTVDYRKFTCEQLSRVGSQAEVPALAALLTDKELSLAARSALERIPGDAALAAMRAALPRAAGAVRVGLISSLGERRDAEAVPLVAAALADEGLAAPGAALHALGRIGTVAAADALATARKKLPASLQPQVTDAMLCCAAGLLAAGDRDRAAGIYEELSAPTQPKHVRIAAFPGLVRCRRDRAGELIRSALRDKDPAMQHAGVRAVRAAEGDAALMQPVLAELPRLAPPIRAMVIDMLAERGAADALPAVLQEASADRPGLVRRAAVSALGKLGNASVAAFLAKLAAGAAGPDQRLARVSLVRLRGQDVDHAMIAALDGAEAPVRRELIIALRDRQAKPAVNAFLAAAKDADRAVRAEALKALGALGETRVCAALIALLASARDEADRRGIETALAAVCRRAGGTDKAAEPLLQALAGADAKLTGSLLGVLARIGGDKALAAIREALKHRDREVRTAAIRALADWPDATPLEDLLAAASADDAVPRVLALRGFVRLSARATDRKPEALAGLYARALKLARRAEEKKLLLGGLAGLHCTEALAMAERLMEDSALANEAAMAAVRIGDALWRSKPAAVKRVLGRVSRAGVAPSVRAEAARVLLELSRPRNLALDAKATSPDGWENDGAAGGDQAAIDGNPNTYWDEQDGKKLYRLVITFPERRRAAVIRITGYRHHAYAPKDFEVLCDGKVVKAVRNATYRANRLTVAFAPVECRSLELKITSYYGQSPAVRELEIFGLDPAEAAKKAAATVGAEPRQ